MLYDIKHTKPALDIKSGAFYNGIPDYSIKAKNKLPDGKTLLDIIIYDHTTGRGNKTVIMADSSLMYTIMDDRYLKLELYDGHYYSEEPVSESSIDRFHRTEYDKMDMVFSLASFDLKRRKEELFQNNRQMKNISELSQDIDSFRYMVIKQKANFIQSISKYFDYHMDNKDKITNKGDLIQQDSIEEVKMEMMKSSLFPSFLFDQKSPRQQKKEVPKIENLWPGEDTLSLDSYNWLVINADSITDIRTPVLESIDSLKEKPTRKRPSIESKDKLIVKNPERNKLKAGKIDTLKWNCLEDFFDEKINSHKLVFSTALSRARNMKVNLNSTKTRLYQYRKDANLYTIEMQKKYAQALACILMFLIGAPLGAIIKKGGLGVPTIIAIFFFIIYYVFFQHRRKAGKSRRNGFNCSSLDVRCNPASVWIVLFEAGSGRCTVV